MLEHAGFPFCYSIFNFFVNKCFWTEIQSSSRYTLLSCCLVWEKLCSNTSSNKTEKKSKCEIQIQVLLILTPYAKVYTEEIMIQDDNVSVTPCSLLQDEVFRSSLSSGYHPFFFPLNKAKPSCVPHHIKLPGFFPIFPVSLILRVKSQPGTKLSSSELCSYRSNVCNPASPSHNMS